jgi:outer membrane scaffolding protein for murein synthesis (MipA/OmpV family)
MQKLCPYHLIWILVLICISQNVAANRLLDYIRNTDLNDYALGVALATSQNMYKGEENGTYAYPYLTSFRDSAFTANWLVAGEGDLGIRRISDSGWTFGVVGRIQTRGLASNAELPGIAERESTLELAPAIGYRNWPLHINFKSYFEVLDRHKGQISQLAFSYPKEWKRGYLVPALEIIYQSDDYSDYYYGVGQIEAMPDRPTYDPGSVLNTSLKLSWGYALTNRWLMSGRIGIEQLDDEITASPLVDRDKIWSVNLGLAYNANIFQSREYEYSIEEFPRTAIKLSVLSADMNTTLVGNSATFDPGSHVDIEDLLGLPDRKTIAQFDVHVRLAGYHRLEMSYTDLDRSGSTVLADDIDFRDTRFLAGTTVESSVETKIMKLAYGYSLIRDSQKELGVTAGFHKTRMDVEFTVPMTGQRQQSEPSPLLPVLGAYGVISLGSNTTVSAQAQVFRMDFDRYEGSLSFVRIEVQQLMGRFGLGLGYSYYSMNLDSHADDLQGSLEFRHHGPVAFLSVRF